jgi:hypothetical protein
MTANTNMMRSALQMMARAVSQWGGGISLAETCSVGSVVFCADIQDNILTAMPNHLDPLIGLMRTTLQSTHPDLTLEHIDEQTITHPVGGQSVHKLYCRLREIEESGAIKYLRRPCETVEQQEWCAK